MESNDHGKVAILLDFENLARAAMNDSLVAQDAESMRIIFLTIGKKMLDVAKEYGAVKRAYLAFSRPKEKDKENPNNIHLTHEMIAEINSLYDHSPYTVISTVSADNAVDNDLVRMGMPLIEDPDIATLIVGSGDGREPFAKLFRECVNGKKRLHVVFYEKKPHILHGNIILHAETFLAGDIRFAVEAGKTPVMPNQTEEEKLSPAKTYKKILRAIMNPTENKCDRASEQYKHVVHGLEILKNALQSAERYRVKRSSERMIAELLIREFFDKSGTKMGMNTALDLTRAFVFMNVFSSEFSYSINENSEVFTAAEWDRFHHSVTGAK